MSKQGRTSLAEVMGSKADKASKSGLDFSDLPKLLGDQMPKLEFHTLGRVRLIRALRNRFGENFRSVPGISELMQKFDHETKITLQHHTLKKKLSRLGEENG